MQPILTIAFPTYNRASRLSVALESLVAEVAGDLDKIEIFISDNASDDDTPVVVGLFAEKHPEATLRYVRQTINEGMDANFHYLLYNARGRYALLLSDDDKLIPGRMSRVIRNLLNVNDGGVYCIDSPGFSRGKQWGFATSSVDSELMVTDRDGALRFMHSGLFFLSSTIVPVQKVPKEMEAGKGSHIFTAYVFSEVIGQVETAYVDTVPLLALTVNGKVSYNMPHVLIVGFAEYYAWLAGKSFSANAIQEVVDRHFGWFLRGTIMHRKLQRKDLPREYYNSEAKEFRRSIQALHRFDFVKVSFRLRLLLYTFIPVWVLVAIRILIRQIKKLKRLLADCPK